MKNTVEIYVRKGLLNDKVCISNSGVVFEGVGHDVDEALDKAIEYCKNFNYAYEIRDRR